MTAASARMSATERSRQHRERKRLGLAVFRVEVELDGLRDLLYATGHLAEWSFEDPEEICDALEHLLAVLIAQRDTDT
jgi:hypothetical protein